MKFKIPFFPMLLKEIEVPFDDEKFLYEIKFDGLRAIIHVGKNTFHIYNRHKKEITELYPELIHIKEGIKEDCILDGEIVLFDKNLPSFSKLQERSHLKDKNKIQHYSEHYPVCFMAFDCLYKEKDLTNKTLLERKQILNTIKDNNYLIKTKYILKEGKKLFKKIQKMHLEGIVAKKIDSVYLINTRSEDWIKIKNWKQETFLIGGYVDEKEKAIITLFLGEYRNQKFYFVGKVIAGKKQEIYNKIKKEQIKKTTPFCDFEDKEINYLKPKLSCEIAYIERTKNNHLRQPIFKK